MHYNYNSRHMEKDISTEERIKRAARKVFQEKGYGQARTRDIAEEAGINTALLNYYFRSKEKLFDIIMEESMQQVFGVIIEVLSDESSDLSAKIDMIVNRYIDSLQDNPNLPLFVLSEIQANSKRLMEKVGLTKNLVSSTHLYSQIQEQIDAKGLKGITPLQIFINIVSMSIFPVVGRPLLINLHAPMTEDQYTDFINERRILIPMWIKMMLKLDE